MKNKLPLTEELDFHYLLSLMPPLQSEPEFAWLPELFSIIGHESLVLLCKYAGGETIKIPTLEQLTNSVEALQWFYNTEISKKNTSDEIPIQHRQLVSKIKEIYDVDKY